MASDTLFSRFFGFLFTVIVVMQAPYSMLYQLYNEPKIESAREKWRDEREKEGEREREKIMEYLRE